MRKGEANKIRIKHILVSVDFILDHISSKTENEFYQNELLKYAVQKHLEIIGEAANFLSDSLKDKHQEVEWKTIISARNIYIHAYFNIDWVMIWEIVTDKLPSLKIKIENILEELNADK